MSTSRWERARALFQRALDLPDAQRATFLTAECEGDEAIRREVEDLLAAHDAAGGFLETPAVHATPDAPAPALQAGDRLGRFDVLGVLGRGGMGEVYRAQDTQLVREVAIKVLPRALATDPQRLARFERESRILASLNHPRIAAIHSVEQFKDLRLLVLELVEGPTLGDRLRAGPLSPEEALTLARELADALEAAHDRGIVHRDLKPANIKIAAGSGIKLLDFGLAKEQIPREVVGSDTRVPEGTTEGMIVGTWSYMSPEQARGRRVDKRTDVWAFGCVLFEMLAGTSAFRGDTPSDTVAAVLEREPDWSRLPAALAPSVRRVLRRCLEKDPARRLHDIADVRIEIEDALSNADDPPERTRPRGTARMVAVALAVLAAGIGLGWWIHGIGASDQPAIRTTRFTWALPAGLGLDSPPAISPNGQLVAFTARAATGDQPRLYVRSLSALVAQPLAGTEGARLPFWSPNSGSVAYFAAGKLLKIALAGGTPVEICDVPEPRGGAWSSQGTIVFSPRQMESGLMRVSENGGRVEPATLLDVPEGENSHRWPVFLPDGIHFLYFVRAFVDERRGVYVGRIDRQASTPGPPLFRSESEALYAPVEGVDRGVLLTVARGQIEVRPFDARTRAVTGDPRTIDLPAAGNTPDTGMMLSVSADVLVHGGSAVSFGVRKASIGRNGENLTLGEQRQVQGRPRVSPDGLRLAYQQVDFIRGGPVVWVEDLVRGTRSRVTSNHVSLYAIWSPDGGRLAHVAGSLQGDITLAAADGTGAGSTVECPGQHCEPTDWSPDGRWLLATVQRERNQDVWMLPADGRGTARPLFAQSFPERDARVSPNGRFVAYVSEEAGRPEVSVQRIDGPPQRDVISVAGGDQPVWHRNGRELFFVGPQGLLHSASISMDPDGKPRFGAPVPLRVPTIGPSYRGIQYDVSLDGQRIYFFDRRPEPAPSEFGVVVGWRGLVK
ncbi:MAG TPA: protein kinase [Vicinamibacterales bacterium]|nr:protein kinase [Vicinamibacterales bacterium]